MAARMLFGIFLLILAIGCGLLGTSLPLDLADQSRRERVYYAELKAAGAYVQRTGRLPERALTKSPDATLLYPLGFGGPDCERDFSKLSSDRFVLSFWRGEWTECYAFPSGKTTLAMSVTAHLRQGAWQLLAGIWAVGIVALWAAIRITRELRVAAVAARDAS